MFLGAQLLPVPPNLCLSCLPVLLSVPCQCRVTRPCLHHLRSWGDTVSLTEGCSSCLETSFPCMAPWKPKPTGGIRRA